VLGRECRADVRGIDEGLEVLGLDKAERVFFRKLSKNGTVATISYFSKQ
jgi:hypothetical protein